LARPSKSPERVRFGSFELDCRTGDLRRDGSPLKLQPQPAKILSILVSRAPDVVSRQELVEKVWGAQTFVDYEQGLNFAIRQIRTVLNDDADNPQFLETLPRRGYRFIAEITGDQEDAPTEPLPAPITGPPGRTERRARSWLPGALLAVIALAAIVLLWQAQRHRAEKQASLPIQSVAVLPLTNLSPDPNQEFFSDGLTDELITELARTGNLRVISRSSVYSFKGSRKAAPEIGRDLKVDAIVEGTVERVGNRVRIRAQLIRTATDQHLWAESYDREVGDVLTLESEVARDIAQKIGVQVSPGIRTAKKVDPDAHEDYLRGRYYWNKRTEFGLRKGIEYFQKALERDPNYAPAYAGLADSYIMLANWGVVPPGDAYRKAKAAALKAVEIDDELAEAQTSLAYATLLYDWDWNGAEKRFQQAISLNPNLASAHHFYSILLMSAGRHSQALAEIKRAQELDPLSLIVNDVVGWIQYEARQYPQAIEQYRSTLEMDPNYVPALLDLGTAYLSTGEYPKAIAQFEKARSVGGESGVVFSALAQAHVLSGNKAEGLSILKRIETQSVPVFVSSFDVALVYAAMGQKNKAISLLEKAAEEHVGWIIRIAVDPAFDTLREDPMFKALVKRVGIPATNHAQ
jgi:TolB-like protein/DNA-binding winged helix-turn-helix (wHTH) protein/Tfp pilus assembly protein PilF